MSEKVAAYADSLGLPTTQAGQIKALEIAGVPRTHILAALEDDSRIPAHCLGPIDAAQEPAEPTAPAAIVDANISFGPPQADAQVVYFDSLPDDNGSVLTRVDYQLYSDAELQTPVGGVGILANTLPLTDGTQYYLTALTSETLYYVVFRAVNAIGAGPWSDPFSFTTDVAA